MDNKSGFFSCKRLRRSIVILLASMMLTVLSPAKSFAQCESAPSAISTLEQLILDIQELIGKDIQQKKNFMTEIFQKAPFEMMDRLIEFDTNIRTAIVSLTELYVAALQLQTQQLSTAQIDQTRAIGSLMDAQMRNDAIKKKDLREVEAQRRYMPSELSCQLDTAGPGAGRASRMSRALSRGFALDNAPRHANATGSISAVGTAAEQKYIWDEYVRNFCDNTKGDQGCTTAPGPLAGKDKDIPALLWGDSQTIDMSIPDNKLMTQVALRTLIDPSSPYPIPPGAVPSAAGRQAMLARRAEAARTSAIYNVMGQMLSERAGGSGVDTQAMRIAGGIPDANASTNASYREIQEAMTRERFYNPQYIIQMAGNPAQVMREQGSMNALRMQVMHDIYRRSEEMLFMEAAAYGHALDKQVPSTALHASPLKPF